MTQAQSNPGGTTPGAGPVFPPGRYGRRREPIRRRWLMPTALVLVVVAMAAIAARLYTQYGTDQFSPTVTNLTGVSATSVTVTFRVQKPATAAVCTVDAEAADGAILGTAEVSVPSGTAVTVTATITTTAKAYIAEVPSCRPAS